jgi:predicted DNA-binding ribbon-helix-helix protein
MGGGADLPRLNTAAGGMLNKRSFSLAGHRTSAALEEPFWQVLEAIAAARATTLSALVAGIDAGRTPRQSLASALRLFALLETIKDQRSP